MTLTLSASAAQNVAGVIAAIADLLKVAVPSYRVSRSPSPIPLIDQLTLGGGTGGPHSYHCEYLSTFLCCV